MELKITRYHSPEEELLVHIKTPNNDEGISLSSPSPSNDDPFDLHTNLMGVADFIRKIHECGLSQEELIINEEDVVVKE